MDIQAAAVSENLSADADANGNLTVPTAKFFVGADAYLETAAGYDHVRITKIYDSTHLQITKLVDGKPETGAAGYDASNAFYRRAGFDGTTHGDGSYNAVLQAHTAGQAGNAITLSMTGDAATTTKASFDFSGTGSAFNDVLEAVTGGTGGNAITVALTGDLPAGSRASKDFSTVGTGVFDSTVGANLGTGASGNAITISLAGTAMAGVQIMRSGNAFTIIYQNGTSTVGDIETAIGALTGPDALISVIVPSAHPGTKPTLTTDDFGATHLAGGVDHTGVTFGRVGNAFTFHFEDGYHTVADVETTINALTGGNKLIQIRTPSAAPTATLTVGFDEFTAQSFAGGGLLRIDRVGTAFAIHYIDGVTTVGDINTAIGAFSGGDDLFDVLSVGGPFAVLHAPGANFASASFQSGVTPRLSMPAQPVRVNRKFTKKTSI